MPNVFDETLAWSLSLSMWQRDALRRLVSNEQLSDTDREELLHFLKSENGLVDSGYTCKSKPEPLTKSHYSAPTKAGHSVVILSMHDLKNVNALDENQTVIFGEKGLTLIYGDNAAGKSGYSRVLKRACRAREEKEAVLPNIFAKNVSDRPQAKFNIKVDSSTKTVTWISDTRPPDELAQISVFDSKCERVYIDEASTVAYLPYGLDVFGGLVELCVWMKKELQSELSPLEQIPPFSTKFDNETEVGRFVLEITHETLEADVIKMSNMTLGQSQRFLKLEEELTQLRIKDPTKMAAEIRRKKKRIENLQGIFNATSEILSPAKSEEVQTCINRSVQSTETGLFASAERFKKEPLPGVGSPVWRDMFEAARRYSEDGAYLGKKFPVIDRGSSCVLCQQELTQEAKERLRRFDEFIREELEAQAISAKVAVEELKKSLEELLLRLRTIDEEVFEDLKDIDPEIEKQSKQFLDEASDYVEKVASACQDSKRIVELPNCGMPPSFSVIVKSLEEEAVRKEELGQATNKEKVEAEFKELTARKNLFDCRNEILDHIKVLKKIKQLKACIDQTKTMGITKKGSAIADVVITDKLRIALAQELSDLAMDSVNIALQKMAEAGSPKHRIILPDACVKTDPSRVLSEGEQRAVAIAAFLAEIRCNDVQSGIVFDDPVCSLDYQFSRLVAGRLVREAGKRQVIVFTHDIHFMMELKNRASDLKVQCCTQVIHRDSSGVGICDQELPWIAEKTKKRIGILRKSHQECSARHNKLGADREYEQMVERCYGRMRQTWERAVEEVLLNETIVRYEPDVHTSQLSSVLIEDADCADIDNGMTKCSRWLCGHDPAGSAPEPVPTPEELGQDIDLLDSFVSRVRKRNESVRKNRKTS